MTGWFEELQKRAREKYDFKENMIFSTDYIDWLESFTDEHGSFSTETFLDNPRELSQIDKKNIRLLEALYEVTDEYADNNFITPTFTDFGNFYSIKHNDVGYFIGFDSGQETIFYCTRLDAPEKDALEYKHLMSGVKLPSTVQAEDKLEELSKMIESLCDHGVPAEAIHQTTDATLQKVKVRKEIFK